MTAAANTQVLELKQALVTFSDKNKGSLLTKVESNTALLLNWFSYLKSSISSNSSDRLIEAAQGAIVEAAGCLSIGLARPAVFSIRAQVDLTLGWIYYNDHPVEWRSFERELKDFPLRATVQKYFAANDENYSARIRLLLKHKKRLHDDPYGLLSTHVHSLSATLAPTVSPLSKLVQDVEMCLECATLQRDVAEYLCDVCSAWYANRWHDFPSEISHALKRRLKAKDLKKFLADKVT